MPCTTLLVGKKASFDGSTIIARNEDAFCGQYTPKRFTVVTPSQQALFYQSVLSRFTLDLPDNPLRYTCMPNARPDRGIWGASGVNERNVAMTATETITCNGRVLSADPLVVRTPPSHDLPETPGGIGEEDMLTLVLPYISSAREGVTRMASLLEELGTCEMNGIAFQDSGEIWWMETIGGHHWIARRIPDECYAVIPNQMGIDSFDLSDAFGEQREHMCSRDLIEFIRAGHMNTALDLGHPVINPRRIFGTHSDHDHVYNTPRTWAVQRYFNPNAGPWDENHPGYSPSSDTLPFLMRAEHRITIEDLKRVLSDHYEGTPYDPYLQHGDPSRMSSLRPIAVDRTNFLAIIQIRPDLPEEIRTLEWIAMACNIFNTLLPMYANVQKTPVYLSQTPSTPDTASFYWASRMIACLGDYTYPKGRNLIREYQRDVPTLGHALILRADREFHRQEPEDACLFCQNVNQEIASMARAKTDQLLNSILCLGTQAMRCNIQPEDV